MKKIKKNNVSLGNPLLISAVASNPEIIKSADKQIDSIKNTIKWVVIAGATATIIYFGIKAIKRNNVLKNISTNNNYRASQRIYELLPAKYKSDKSFLNPAVILSNIKSLIFSDMNQKELNDLINTANSITDFNEASYAFKVLYKGDLPMILNKLMTAQQLESFYSNANAYKIQNVELKQQTSNIDKRTITNKDTSVYLIYKTLSNRISKLIRLNKNIPSNTSLGRYTGQNAQNIMPNNNKEYSVSLFGKDSNNNTIYLLCEKNNVRYVNYSDTNYKKLSLKITGEVTNIS